MVTERSCRRLLEALHLRRWAIHALFGPTDVLPNAGITEFGPASWALMLRAERCALPLCTAGVLEGVQGAARLDERLRQEADRELFRALLARTQCEEIGSQARERGWRLAILKGGRSVLDCVRPVYLSDLDLLVHPECLADVRRWFFSAGYRESGGRASHRLPLLTRKGGLPVELHVAIPGLGLGEDLWREMGPEAGTSGFHTLPPREHLWHLMLHSVVQHPNRRGRLRDLYLIVSALDACVDDDERCVQRRAEMDRYAAPLLGLLEMSLKARRRALVTDPFVPIAAASYIWRDSDSVRVLPRSIALLAHSGIFLRLGGPALGGKQWMSHKLGFEYSSVAPGVMVAQRISVPLGRAVRWVARSVPLWLFAPLAFLLENDAKALCRALHSGSFTGGGAS